jgi:ATP-dependent Clp protease ATP-binding subunit ClpX
MALDGVELVFTPDALEAAAEEALRLKTGARGLRTVLENCMLDVMYEVPSRRDVAKCIVDAEVIRGRRHPILIGRNGQVLDLWTAQRSETA